VDPRRPAVGSAPAPGTQIRMGGGRSRGI